MTTVLLYSGGLDSYIAAALYTPDVLLHVYMGGRYGLSESQHITTPPGQEVATVDLPLGAWERPDRIIPGRNAHLCLLAAQYGDTIWLGATAGDRVTDKDEGFADTMTALLQHLYQPQWWLPEGRDVRVALPIKDLTKRELVAAYLDAGHSPQRLVTTFSCYNPINGRECRECKPCLRKWVALELNGVSSFDCSVGAARAWDAGMFKGRGVEEDEVRQALNTAGVRV